MTRALGLGAHRSNKGDRGVEKRITALAGLTELSGGRLLDVGCGDGTYTRRLAAGFDHVTAVDVEPERLAVFRSEVAGTELAGKLVIRQMPAEQLDLPDASFDVVTTIEVLEHVRDLDASLAEIHRVLVPGGRFLITSPNRWFPFETHGFFVLGKRRPPRYGPFLPWIVPLHRRLADARSFTVRGLSRQIEAQGFRLVGVDYIMPPFDRSGLGGRIRPLTDGIERSRLSFFGMALILVLEKV
ncbi:Methyltransferase type 11 [Kribbella flavida DSM 17836]|uniref:Methyltransferase type 11 n=1 Tax=Kribbella flavida (strain DSM 17836 / JCM 10339 / NBRC 14399) TaxID=479435 RepID=D2PYZ5_KRIFD|nr:class I SAM-dependent methyltransferase [Kribbella flavida]ADB31789.1 Methyltransferase type 11 [Kribbella flavida DSM 17836]